MITSKIQKKNPLLINKNKKRENKKFEKLNREQEK